MPLEDGTVMTDIGGATLTRHPSNDFVVYFAYNPDRLRRIERAGTDPARPWREQPGMAASDGLIVLSAREARHAQEREHWVWDDIVDHEKLVQEGNARHGLVIQTGESAWDSGALEYRLKKPKSGENNGEKHRMTCAYGIGITDDRVLEKETLQRGMRWLFRWMTRDRITVHKSEFEDIVLDHFRTAAPRICEGDYPYDVTYDKTMKNTLAERVREKKISRRFLGAKKFLYMGVATGILFGGAALAKLTLAVLGRASAQSFFMTALRVGLRWTSRAVSWPIAAAMAVGGFMGAVFGAGRPFNPWTITDKRNIAAKYYDAAANRFRLYQRADAERAADCTALDLRGYNCIRSGVKVEKEEPEWFILNRLYNTASMRRGSAMQRYKLGKDHSRSHDVLFYQESNGVRRVRIPGLNLAFVTYAHAQEKELEVSGAEKAILNEGEVIMIRECPETGELSKAAMSYTEYEAELNRIAATRCAQHVPNTHPDHRVYQAYTRAAQAEWRRAALKKAGNAVRWQVDRIRNGRGGAPRADA